MLDVHNRYRPQTGSIQIDGVELEDVDTNKWRRQISVVSQDVRLFDRTILDNIAFRPPAEGSKALTPSERVRAAEKAAAAAYASEFIAAKAGEVESSGEGTAHGAPGFDFQVGHRGEKLSGGQRQRIAIARALYAEDAKGPQTKVVLLDEATSALDAESEKHVQNALSMLANGRTTVVVAHRLSTIRSADRICVLSEGVVKEQGTFEELTSDRDSLFHRLYAEHLAREAEGEGEGDYLTVEGDNHD
jgi:ABC-type multidrug transport system fused ATPase/permease subunit